MSGLNIVQIYHGGDTEWNKVCKLFRPFNPSYEGPSSLLTTLNHSDVHGLLFYSSCYNHITNTLDHLLRAEVVG